MNFSQTISEVKRITDTGKYNVLPVSLQMLSDFTTPIETMKILKNVSTHCYMLESAQANETWGRYTFLGFDPKMEITCIGGTMNGVLDAGNMKYVTGNPSDYLRRVLSGYKSPRFDYLPSFTGGLVGYFSYDYLGYSEPSVRCSAEDTENFKDVVVTYIISAVRDAHIGNGQAVAYAALCRSRDKIYRFLRVFFAYVVENTFEIAGNFADGQKFEIKKKGMSEVNLFG